MPEDDLDLDVETTEETFDLPPEGSDWRAKVQKQNRELASLRERAKEAEALAAQILQARASRFADVEPEGLSPKSRLAWLEKMEAKYPEASGPSEQEASTEDEAEAQEPQTETERKLAAVAGQASNPAQTTQSHLSAKELGDLMQRDPARAVQLMNAKYAGNP